MNEKINSYLKRQMYNKIFNSCNYYILCDKEEYSGSIGKCNLLDSYKFRYFVNVLVINTLVSILINEKELRLDTKVKEILPDFMYDDVAIIHLLTHSSGLVKKIDNKKYDTGSTVCFDDVNFKILRTIIEKLYTTDMELLARSFIFEPLGMNDTKLVKNHITTTITDLSHFTRMILNDGYYNRKFFIDIKYIDTWFKPLYINDKDIRTTVGWVFGPSTDLCKNIDFSLNTVCFDENSYIIIDRDNELIMIFLFDKVDNSKRNNINKYIFNELKKIGKIY